MKHGLDVGTEMPSGRRVSDPSSVERPALEPGVWEAEGMDSRESRRLVRWGAVSLD